MLGAASEPPGQDASRLGPDKQLKLGGETGPLPPREDLRQPDRPGRERQRHRCAGGDRGDAARRSRTIVLERVGREASASTWWPSPRRARMPEPLPRWRTRPGSRPSRPLILRSADARRSGRRGRGGQGLAAASSALRQPAAAEELLPRCQGERPRAGRDRAGPRPPGGAGRRNSKRRASTTCCCSSTRTRWPSSSRPTPSPAAPPSRTTSSRWAIPILRFIETGNLLDDTVEAVTEITKYGGICVLPGFDPAQMASLHDPAAQHLHRPAEAHPGRAEGLRRSASPRPIRRSS